jgi:hypothetical protein
MERDAHRTWERTATRPLTQAAIGVASAGKRQRDATLSRLWTPERTLRMFRRPTMVATADDTRTGASHTEV